MAHYPPKVIAYEASSKGSLTKGANRLLDLRTTRPVEEPHHCKTHSHVRGRSTIAWIYFITCIQYTNQAYICNCSSGIWNIMDPEQAKNLVKKKTHLIRDWVIKHCGKDTHLVPLALLHVNRHLAEKDWQLICRYDGKQPFEKFVWELTEEALEAFSYGVWFGKCANTIHHWLEHYEVKDQNKRQDAEDYIKNKLAKDNFARFKSYKKTNAASFSTYIHVIIRNLLIDYLRKKTTVTETLDSTQNSEILSGNDAINDIAESYKKQHLEEIGQWFFAGSTSQENDKAIGHPPDIPDAIKLSPKDRLFLRAIYKDGMSIAEAGRLPGINMGKLQAYKHHRKLKKRIKKLLHAMGYANLQSLLNPN